MSILEQRIHKHMNQCFQGCVASLHPISKSHPWGFHLGTKINRVDPALSSQPSVKSVGESIWLVFVPFLTKPAVV